MIRIILDTKNSEARTLPIEVLNKNSSGWIFKAEIQEDYYEWINSFEANHPLHGSVWGDFEDEIYANSLDGFINFITNHPPQNWDYGDI